MKIVIALFLTLFLQEEVYCAQIHLDDEIQNIPAKITEIYSCGSWKQKESTGSYRIIYIEFYNGCSLLYIQWMSDSHNSVLHTLSIDEFNADDHIELTYEKPDCEGTKDGIKLNITADSGYEDNKHYIELDIFHEFGKYSFKDSITK